MQSEKRREFFMAVATALYPQVFAGTFKWKHYYQYFRYSGLISIHVSEKVKLSSYKWDYAFNVICTYSHRKKKDGNEWFAERGSLHELHLRCFTVVERQHFFNPLM